MEKIGVLFVCLGNICRSPMAEGVFEHLVEKEGLSSNFKIDSCGTSAFHEGEKADRRMRKTAEAKGIELTSRSRPFLEEDFDRFDYILPMDKINERDLRAMAERLGADGTKIKKMRDFDPEPGYGDVPDPYYGGEGGFEEVYEILIRSNQKLLEYLREKHGI